MNKVIKMIVFILIVSLLGSIFYIVYTDKNLKEYKIENTTLNEQLEGKNIEILDLQNKIKFKEDEVIEQDREQEKEKQKAEENAKKEIEELTEVNIALMKELDEFKELNKEYEDTFGNDDLETERLKFELSCKLVNDSMLIDLNLSENRAIELFGQPIKENVEIIGSEGIWYLEGKYSKESIYNKFTLYYYGDNNGTNYELVKFSTDNSSLYLTNEIRVGDSLEDLLVVYPMMIEDTWSKDEVERYLYPDRFGMRGIFFEIENEKVSKITISRLFD